MSSRASAQVNPYVGLTFIPDNPRMEVPPSWFLARLHDYDADLVLLPSKARPFAYVVARRARLSRGLTSQAMTDTITQPDTRMCFHYGLVPVCVLFKHGPTWDADSVIRSLAARDTWAQGGGEALADRLDAEESAAKAKQHDEMRDRLRHVSRDAYRIYKRRTGQRTSVPGPSRIGAAITQAPHNGLAAGIALT